MIRRELESKNNFVKLIQLICEEYKLDPVIKTNIINIRSFLQPIDVDSIVSNASSVDEANKKIVKLYGSYLKSNTTSIPHEMNKTKEYLIKMIKTPGDDAKNGRSIYKGTFGNKSDESFTERLVNDSDIVDMNPARRIETIKYLNYSSLFRDEYIVIDSRYQNTVNPDPTKMIFSLITSTKTKSDHGGVIVGSAIKDIIEVEAFPFTIPYKPVYATFYNKITLSINEWLSSSFEAYEGGQFHFCFDIEKIDENLIYLKPINSTYSFSKPVNYIDSFSLSFGAMLPKISFDPDRMYPSRIDYSNEYGLFEFSTQHNLVTGDLIYISGFNTSEPARDQSIINEVNRSAGHMIVKKDNYSFIINVDLRPLRTEYPIGSGQYPVESFEQQALVYFASKRVQIQLRLKYLTSYTES